MQCHICKGGAKIENQKHRSLVSCPRCGRYEMEDSAALEIAIWNPERRVNLSGWLSENQGSVLSVENIQNFAQLRTPSIGEKAIKLLVFLAKEHPKAGQRFKIFTKKFGVISSDEWTFPPRYLSACWAYDEEELRYIIDSYLTGETSYFLSFRSSSEINHTISPKGWAYLETLRRGEATSQVAFIAMWFDKSVDPAHSAIAVGIRQTGYNPLRIDGKEHNNKIDDEIVADIRRSKFLVADFTGHRGGVYFEAGLALGLGLPVIWLCRNDQLKETHFDTRQYNFILWEADKLDELSKALKNRIEATIGRGPLQPTT